MQTADGFLNVDLEIGAASRARLAPLIDAVGDQLFELFRGRLGRLYQVHYETSGCARDANATIHELADCIEALPAAGRGAWKAAAMRVFNVGVELERGVRMVELAIDLAAMQRIVALGGRIAFTAYQVAAWKRARLR